MTSMTSESCARVFVDTWISRFGVPTTITSDRGPQFTSSLWARMCELLGMEHVPTTSYHPQSNGMVERFHRSLKSSLRAQSEPTFWVSNLPLVLLGLRTVPKEDTGSSSSKAVFGTQLCLPGEFIDSGEMSQPAFIQRINQAVSNFSNSVPRHRSVQPRVPPALKTCKFVFIREDACKPPLSPLYRGPFLVLERASKFFKVQIGERSETVSINRLKPVFSAMEVTLEVPVCRGRPPVHPPAPSSPSSTRAPVPDVTPVPAPTRIQRAQAVKSVRLPPRPPCPQ